MYNFYDKKSLDESESVFIVGSSVVGYAIYPPEINRLLTEGGYNITVYNLFVNSQAPLELVIQAENIIAAHPKMVIIGMTPRNLNYKSFQEERVALVYDRLRTSSDSLYLFTDSEKEILSRKPDIFYFKKYLTSAFKAKYHNMSNITIMDFGSEIYYTNDYDKDPMGLEFRLYRSNNPTPVDELLVDVDSNPDWHPVITNETSQQKEAIIYFTRKLMNENICVIIINMPLNPVHSEKIDDVSRRNYHDFLNQTRVKWYNMEQIYGTESFVDHAHLSYYGALDFAPHIADIITQEVECGAIHYT